jgi:hypothetical protein
MTGNRTSRAFRVSGLLRFEPWKIAIVSFIAGVGATVGLGVLLYFLLGETREKVLMNTSGSSFMRYIGW